MRGYELSLALGPCKMAIVDRQPADHAACLALSTTGGSQRGAP